jgi:hypothetical protein
MNYKHDVKELQIKTDLGYLDFSGVALMGTRPTLKFTFSDSTFIEVTTEHRFVVDGYELSAIDLNVGEVLQAEDGERYKEIVDIEFDEKQVPVYDIIDVNGIKRYYSNGVLSHNCQFIGSTATLIDADVLQRIPILDPIDTKWTGLLLIYEHPKDDAKYCIGVDVAEGCGKDYSVLQILRIDSEEKLEQVAVFRDNTTPVDKFAQISIAVSEYYNNAYLMIENNGVGHLLAYQIWHDFEYEMMVNLDGKNLGVKSDKKTKLEANTTLKKYMENDWLILHDKTTGYELSMYEEVKPNIFRCPQDYHDDCVTSLFWAVQFINTTYYEEKSFDKKEVEDEYQLGPIIFTNETLEDEDPFDF